MFRLRNGRISRDLIVMASSSSSLSSIRSWRTAFLTLRDETLTLPARTSLPNLLHNLIFSQSHSLISAAPNLPPHELTSDLLFLFELVATTSQSSSPDVDDFTLTYTHISHLIHNASQCIVLDLSSSSWAFFLDSYEKTIEYFLGKSVQMRDFGGDIDSLLKAIIECLNTLWRLSGSDYRKCSQAENLQLLKFLFRVVALTHGKLSLGPYCSSGNIGRPLGTGANLPRYNSIWEVQTVAFTMIGEVYSRIGSSIPVEVWKLGVEVLRKVMDALASKSLLVEDNVMSRFYISMLNCLHLVLSDPKCSLSDHVAGFVATLRMFLFYGLAKNYNMARPVVRKSVLDASSINPKKVAESTNSGSGPYRPPHLRKKEGTNLQLQKASDPQSFTDHEISKADLASSDSDYSDSDGSFNDYNYVSSSKARVLAIVCIQDICQADPKSFTSQWTMLLPSSDVLQPRKHEATLMACLLFEPHLKTRIASASTLIAMLDGPTSVFLQVAEYKEPTKCGSFTPLSNSLGQILLQLHNGILHLIQRESHSGLLASLFKILLLLISSTPYPRMPVELLPAVISSLRSKVEEGFSSLSDQPGLLIVAVNCLAAALSTSPSSPQVKKMLLEESSIDFSEAREKRGILLTIFLCIERVTSPAVSFEALQALRAVFHNYPITVSACWQQISNMVYESLSPASLEIPKREWNGHHGNTVGLLGEKVITASIRVLDECLRAISGFRGTEDLLDDKYPDTPFTSECVRIKTISSAPSYGPRSPEGAQDALEPGWSGNEQWCEAIEWHMPLILHHSSAMVRAASVTCFAGITSFCFFSLTKEKQNFILSSVINAAANNEAPSVKSAACRAIGVITCFPQIFERTEILNKFIRAAEINTRDPLASVRITSSWALANICDSLRHYVNDSLTNKCCIDLNEHSQSMALLLGCALRLTKDGDKIKSNAVRALGNLSRFVNCTRVTNVCGKQVYSKGSSLPVNDTEESSSCNGPERCQRFISKPLQSAYLEESQWLGKMVQAFLSCVTTGNVKVQWNVCHALSNLFLNVTLRLQDVDWAPSVFSILLLLLRDSSNFKIRIQAAAALSVPSSVVDYGSSFSDVVQGLVHILENLSSDKISAPSSFKYRIALEKQLISTMLHVLSLASGTDYLPLQDFFVKKLSFLEEWLKGLCMSLADASIQAESDVTSTNVRKKEMISKAIQSLVKIYSSRSHRTAAQRFEKLADIIR